MTQGTNLNDAAHFLEALSGRQHCPFTFQTFSDGEDKDSLLVRILHGTLDEHGPELVTLNDRGAGIFVTVNETDLKGRKTENIVAVRALFIDADGPITRPWGLEPDIIVQSGRGIHAYWKVRNAPLETFTPAQKQLAAYYGTDPKVCDLPRVMRLPGFFYWKHLK